MKQVPFFANTADNTHCVQASFRMVLKYFLPERDFSWSKLDKMTHKQPNKGTWWFPMLVELKKLGLKVKLIENFDYQRYQKEGNSYVLEVYGPEIGQWHIEETNLTDIKALIPEFLGQINWQLRPATLKDLDKLLADGWLVIIDVNSRTLNRRTGFSGHVVVVYDKVGANYVINDPGKPPKKAKHISRNLLLEAWEFAGKNTTALVAVKA